MTSSKKTARCRSSRSNKAGLTPPLGESITWGTSPWQGGWVSTRGARARDASLVCDNRSSSHDSRDCKIGRSSTWHPPAKLDRAPASRQTVAGRRTNHLRQMCAGPDQDTSTSLRGADLGTGERSSLDGMTARRVLSMVVE
jgi:hypothetical protein